MPIPATATSHLALALLEAGGQVTGDARWPVADLVRLAETAATFGATLTLRHCAGVPEADLLRVARAGRGRVGFDLAG